MEICTMDKPSHFYPGITSQQMTNLDYDFSEVNNDSAEDGASSYVYDKTHPKNIMSECQEYRSYDSESNWKNENVECKQEIESPSFMNLNENSNYGSDVEFKEPFQYNQVSPLYTNDTKCTTNAAVGHFQKHNNQQHRLGPYHITDRLKNQLPSWYNPPSNAYYNAQQPNIFQHQYPYQGGNFLGSPSAAVGAVEHGMRNMTHLNNRYFPFSASAESRWSDNKLRCQLRMICRNFVLALMFILKRFSEATRRKCFKVTDLRQIFRVSYQHRWELGYDNLCWLK